MDLRYSRDDLQPSLTMRDTPYWKLVLGFTILFLLFYGSNQNGSRFINSTKEKSTLMLCVEIAGSLSSFYADYSTLPIEQPDSDWQGDTKHSALVAVLTTTLENPQAQKLNPRHINYLDGFKPAMQGPVAGVFQNGIDFSTASSPVIYDAWGQPLLVIIDTTLDGKITNPITSDPKREILGKRSLVYSTGPPQADGTRNTDESKFIKSW